MGIVLYLLAVLIEIVSAIFRYLVGSWLGGPLLGYLLAGLPFAWSLLTLLGVPSDYLTSLEMGARRPSHSGGSARGRWERARPPASTPDELLGACSRWQQLPPVTRAGSKEPASVPAQQRPERPVPMAQALTKQLEHSRL